MSEAVCHERGDNVAFGGRIRCYARPSAYLQCMCYLLVLFCQFYDRLPLMCTTGPSIHATGLILDLAVILILSSYSPYASYLPYLTFAHSHSLYSLTHLCCYCCMWLISYPFDSIFFALDTHITDASSCQFPLSLHVSLSFYDSTLLYLYKYYSLRPMSLQTWSPCEFRTLNHHLSFTQSSLFAQLFPYHSKSPLGSSPNGYLAS